MLDFSLSGFKYITLLPFEYHSVFSPNELITSVTTMGMIGFLKSKTAKLLFLLFVMLISANTSTSEASAAVFTHESETQVLRDLFRSLNRPQQLKNWKLESGDPCNESWTGVRCNESSITHLKLNGLGLNGTLCSQLSNLRNLKLLDISSNSIEGPIPNSLPLNVTHLIFAENKFSESFLYVIGELIHLRQLNLSHNALSGPLPNVFTALENLHEMDLSFNSFIGDLPPSFQSLTNVTRLFLESNQLTGSVHFLANMPLSDLNIMDNHFTGVIPDNFQFICNLTGGNSLNKEIKEAPSSSHFHTFASLKFSKFLFITSEKRAKLSYEPQYTRGQNVARLVFGILGNIFKLCLFLSEIVTVILFNNENGTGDCKPYPYLVMMCNSCIWIILVEHFPVKTWIILVINIVGLVLNFIYALIFWQYTRSGWYQNFLLYGGILAGIILCVYGIPILNAIPYTHRALVAGIVCVLCTIASYAYPTLVLCNSPDESGATFPMLSSVFGLLSGIAWTVYGLIGPNPYAFTAIGNATGCLVSLAEIYVHGDFTFGGNNYERTAGFKAETVECKNISFTIWDVYGQDKVGDRSTMEWLFSGFSFSFHSKFGAPHCFLIFVPLGWLAIILYYTYWYRVVKLRRIVMESFPTVLYNAGSGVFRDSKCLFCHKKFAENDELKVLPECLHCFHKKCAYFNLGALHSGGSLCPVCRTPIRIVVSQA